MFLFNLFVKLYSWPLSKLVFRLWVFWLFIHFLRGCCCCWICTIYKYNWAWYVDDIMFEYSNKCLWKYSFVTLSDKWHSNWNKSLRVMFEIIALFSPSPSMCRSMIMERRGLELKTITDMCYRCMSTCSSWGSIPHA